MTTRELNDSIERALGPPGMWPQRMPMLVPKDRLFLACEEATCTTDHEHCPVVIMESRKTIKCVCECHAEGG